MNPDEGQGREEKAEGRESGGTRSSDGGGRRQEGGGGGGMASILNSFVSIMSFSASGRAASSSDPPLVGPQVSRVLIISGQVLMPIAASTAEQLQLLTD